MLFRSFTGTAPVLNAMLGGQVDYECDPVLGTLTHVRAGTVKALAVTTLSHSALAPELPEVLRDLGEVTSGVECSGAFADRVAAVMAGVIKVTRARAASARAGRLFLVRVMVACVTVLMAAHLAEVADADRSRPSRCHSAPSVRLPPSVRNAASIGTRGPLPDGAHTDRIQTPPGSGGSS